MNKRRLLRVGRVLALVLAMLLLFVLGVLILPLTEGADTAPVEGSADWMARLPDDTPLDAIVIPGTHDSATQYVQLAYFAKCQSLSIGEQLEAGFRYLDIRLGDADKGGVPRLMHGFTNCKRSLLGGKLYLDAVLADCYASLTYIYGISRTTAVKICEAAKVDPTIRVKDMSDAQMNAVRAEVAKLKVEGDLRREVALNIKRLTEIGCYRGIRHKKGLPVRGQKTKTNARTRKGPRKTIANKKVAPK